MRVSMDRVPAAVRLVFIAAGSAALARTANSGISIWLEPDVLMATREPAWSPPHQATLDVGRVARLFGLTPAKEAPTTGVTDAPATTVRDEHLQLLAMIVSGRTEVSTALLIDEARVASMVRVGDVFHALRIEAMTREPFQVIAWNMLTNQEEVIASAGLSGPTSLVPATSDVRQLDPTHRVISRERFQRTINDLGSIAGDARVIPLRRDGRNIGWQVTSLQPGSLLASIGLKDGDTLLRINGFKLDAPEKALEAYQRLREAVVFDLDIERAGAPVRMNYRVGE